MTELETEICQKNFRQNLVSLELGWSRAMVDGNSKSYTATNTHPNTTTAMFILEWLLSIEHLQILVCLLAVCVKLCVHSYVTKIECTYLIIAV